MCKFKDLPEDSQEYYKGGEDSKGYIDLICDDCYFTVILKLLNGQLHSRVSVKTEQRPSEKRHTKSKCIINYMYNTLINK